MSGIELLALVSVGNAVGISIGSMTHGPGAWLRKRLEPFGWLGTLAACSVCVAFWAGSAAGGAAYALTGDLVALSAGCLSMTAQYGLVALGSRK